MQTCRSRQIRTSSSGQTLSIDSEPLSPANPRSLDSVARFAQPTLRLSRLARAGKRSGSRVPRHYRTSEHRSKSRANRSESSSSNREATQNPTRSSQRVDGSFAGLGYRSVPRRHVILRNDHLTRNYAKQSGKTKQLFKGHCGPVTCLDFYTTKTAKRELLISGSWDKSFKVWDLQVSL